MILKDGEDCEGDDGGLLGNEALGKFVSLELARRLVLRVCLFRTNAFLSSSLLSLLFWNAWQVGTRRLNWRDARHMTKDMASHDAVRVFLRLLRLAIHVVLAADESQHGSPIGGSCTGTNRSIIIDSKDQIVTSGQIWSGKNGVDRWRGQRQEDYCWWGCVWIDFVVQMATVAASGDSRYWLFRRIRRCWLSCGLACLLADFAWFRMEYYGMHRESCQQELPTVRRKAGNVLSYYAMYDDGASMTQGWVLSNQWFRKNDAVEKDPVAS